MIKVDSEKSTVRLEGQPATLVKEVAAALYGLLEGAADTGENTYKVMLKFWLDQMAVVLDKVESEHDFDVDLDTLNEDVEKELMSFKEEIKEDIKELLREVLDEKEADE